MAQIRQEINLSTREWTVPLGSTVTDNTRVQIDTTQYNGTVTYYWEVLYTSDTNGTNGAVLSLRNVTDSTTVSGSIAIQRNQTSPILARSSAITPTAGAKTYCLVDNSHTTDECNYTIKSARIVIIQNAATLTNTETQIEIGNYNLTRTTETAAILTNPKYWQYVAAKWDGTKTFYAEAVYDSGSMDTVTVGIYESASIETPSWSLNATIVSAATTTVPTRTRVAFTPVDGRWYTIFSHNGSMDDHDIYRAGVVVNNITEATYFFDTSDGGPLDNGGSWTSDANAFDSSESTFASGTVGSIGQENSLEGEGTTAPSNSDSTQSVQYVKFRIRGDVSTGDNARVKVYDDGQSQTLLDLTTNFTDGPLWSSYSTLTVPTGGWTWAKVQALEVEFWGSGGAAQYDIYKCEIVVGYGTVITLLEPQYLLANTLFAAGTGLQTFLTKWDSTEWSGVTNTYYFQAEAANGSTSDVELWEADGGGSGLGVLTNIDNAQISSAVTLPTSQNMDTKATTNAGDVAAARILVTVVVDAAADTPQPPSFPFNRKTAPATYSPGPMQYFERLKNLLRPIFDLWTSHFYKF